MSDDFKKLDDWMMDAAKNTREQKIPEGELKDFHEGVMRKIMERQNAGAGFPYMGLAFVAALSLAVTFGAVIYMKSVKVEPVTQEEASEIKPVAAAPVLQQEIPEIKTPVPQPKVQASAPALNEAEIIDEIEALKELGAWTEEDEAEAGIPVEVTFGDLDFTPNSQAQPAIPAALS